MSLHALIYEDQNGKECRLHIHGGSCEQAAQKFKDIEQQLLFSRKPTVMTKKQFFWFPDLQ